MTEQETSGTSRYHVLLAGVDTLVLNVRYADEKNRPVKQELTDELVEQFDLWQKEARQEESTVPTPLVFAGETLLMYPHGAGKGQWKWLLTCRAFNLALGRGRLNGIIAQVRLSSEYLWSCQDDGKQDIAVALVRGGGSIAPLFLMTRCRLVVRQIGGCASTLSAWLGGKQDDLPLEGIEQVPILTQTQDYHFVLHWLHEHLPRYVMVALVARVNPDRPEIIWTKYGAKFAGDVSSKRVLYGLQAIA